MTAAGPTRSGPCPDLTANQRSRAGGSSAAEAVGQPTPLADNRSVPAALDATGSAPLPERLGDNSGGQGVRASLLHPANVAAMLGVTTGWVYAQSRAGRIPTVKLGRYYRYRREAIEAWLEQIECGTLR